MHPARVATRAMNGIVPITATLFATRIFFIFIYYGLGRLLSEICDEFNTANQTNGKRDKNSHEGFML
jgi:hypothetical protein